MIDGYRIERVVSRGGMGVVYCVTSLALGQRYALKLLAPELAHDAAYLRRFRREIQLAASLRHPHATEVHYAGEVGGRPFLVMDFVDGVNLRELIARDGALGIGRSVRLLSQIAGALDEVHRLGLVHRDIKPANVLVTERGGLEHAYLTDFGLARGLETRSDLTRSGQVMGTVDYMAPEQVTGGRIDARTDVYSLGCVFFQMITGTPPFARQNTAATMWAQVYDPQPPLSATHERVPPPLEAVLAKSMAKDPDDRYLSAGDFGRDATAAHSGTRYEGRPTIVATGEATPRPVAAEARNASAAGPGTLGEHEDDDEPRPALPEDRHASTPVEPSAGVPVGAAGPGPAAGTRWRRRRPLVALLALGLLAAVIGVTVLLRSGSSAPPERAGERFSTALEPILLSRVTGAGDASVVLHGHEATVTVTTNGLLADTHLMHIHAGARGTCPPESAARFHNGHRVILALDGGKYYGAPLTSLTTFGDTSAQSVVAFERFPDTSNIRYSHAVRLPLRVVDDIRNGTGVIVIHGIDFNGNGKYDSVLGLRDLQAQRVYGPSQADYKYAEATAPALCGPLRRDPEAHAGRVQRYTATLSTEGSASTLLCVLAPVGSP